MIAKLIDEIKKKDSPIVVGLDPTLAILPDYLKERAFEESGPSLEAVADAVFEFNAQIIEAVADLVPAVKPQIAMYEQFGVPGMIAFYDTVEFAKEKGLVVIGDVKRGDIGSTSTAYANAHIGTIKLGDREIAPFDEDFVTVNPYLGTDGVAPFVDVAKAHDKGLFVLVKTSNPSSGEFQDQKIEGRALYEMVAEKVNEWGADSIDESGYSNVGAVVGATYPEIGAAMRKAMPKSYILVPGYGAQGASGSDLKAFFNDDGLGAIVNSSRGIIAAYQNEKYKSFGERKFAEAARAAVIDMREDINSAIH